MICRFDPFSNIWTKLGDLKLARQLHGVIQVENEFIVVGGFTSSVDNKKYNGYTPTESCKLNGQSMICTTRKPHLLWFAEYPELMLITYKNFI